MKRKAVILFNLGGPDRAGSIKPFLFNFFMDKNIIRLPLPLRFFIAKRISIRRAKREAGESYGELEGKSPLLENTQAQADALQNRLGDDYRVFVCMRYWHPMADEVAAQVKEYRPDEIILLPLYPQFSTTTTRSSFQSWDKAARTAGLDAPSQKTCCYPFDRGFIKASADHIRALYKPGMRLLLSAHGLPQSVIDDGDPYQWQCEQCAEKIVAELGVENLDWQICYQSRVGPMKWTRPSTEEALEKAAADNVPVLIYPHAFVSEHVETLVEIEIEYRELAEKLGVPGFTRVPTVMTHPDFIDGLAGLVKNPPGQKICPGSFRRCHCA